MDVTRDSLRRPPLRLPDGKHVTDSKHERVQSNDVTSGTSVEIEVMRALHKMQVPTLLA